MNLSEDQAATMLLWATAIIVLGVAVALWRTRNSLIGRLLTGGRIVLVGFGLVALTDLLLFGILGASRAGEGASTALVVSATFLGIDLAGLAGTLRWKVWGPAVLGALMTLLAIITRGYDGPWWQTTIWLVGVGIAVAVAVGFLRGRRPGSPEEESR